MSTVNITECPVCEHDNVSLWINNILVCSTCRHKFIDKKISVDDYLHKGLRNQNNKDQQIKIEGRIAFLDKFITNGDYVLEVGCAEGELGQELLKKYSIIYDGIEPSRDSEVARNYLTNIYTCGVEAFEAEHAYDKILLFHVLEHISNPYSVLSSLCGFLSDNGLLVLEVPNGASGSNTIPLDLNPEHIHFFNIISISWLMERAGMEVIDVRSAAFESMVYDDCIRVVAKKRVGFAQKEGAYKYKLRALCGDRFSVYGVGGSFYNLVFPYIDMSHVSYLFDRDENIIGSRVGGKPVLNPDALINIVDTGKILISSIDYYEEIKKSLISKYGVDIGRIKGVLEIL